MTEPDSQRSVAIADDVLGSLVFGVGLSPGNLRDQLAADLTLLVFLRHFGCMFCREMVSDLRSAAEANPEFPSTLFVCQSGATEARAFLGRYWPGARAIADPNLELYEHFGIRRAKLVEALGPQVLAARSRAREKGFSNGINSGDIWRMPGIFAIKNERIIWSYTPKHAVDHPEFERIPEWVRA